MPNTVRADRFRRLYKPKSEKLRNRGSIATIASHSRWTGVSFLARDPANADLNRPMMLRLNRPRLAALTALALTSSATVSCHRPPSSTVPAAQAAAFPGGWADRRRRPPVVAEHAMVASNSELASAA